MAEGLGRGHGALGGRSPAGVASGGMGGYVYGSVGRSTPTCLWEHRLPFYACLD